MADTYELVIVQGERKRLGLRYLVDDLAQSLVGWNWRGQARERESTDSDLILDLTPYLKLNADGVTLDLSIPSDTTYAISSIGKNAAWDVFIWPGEDPTSKILLIQGPVTLDKSSTVLS
jgi:hypothetical protein